jgi:hypothetical protein
MLGWWSRGRVCTLNEAKSRFSRREKWYRHGAVGTTGQSTCMPHVAHNVNKVCWLLACSEELLDIRGERSCSGGGPVVVCTLKAKLILASGKVV